MVTKYGNAYSSAELSERLARLQSLWNVSFIDNFCITLRFAVIEFDFDEKQRFVATAVERHVPWQPAR